MPAAERKHLTLLFADLSGYTELNQRLDPEDVAATVQPLLRQLTKLAVDRGGHIQLVAGDGFLVVFGHPRALEDDTDRAIAAAAEMLQHINIADQNRDHARLLDVHIGIASGELLVSQQAATDALALTGDAINVAARLCDAAKPGRALIARECALASRHAQLDLNQVQRLQLRGLEQPVEAIELHRRDLLRSVPAANQPGFVGRQQHLDQLQLRFDAARRRSESTVVLIHGGAGVGKTRLLRAWLDRQSDSFATGVSCRTISTADPAELLRLAVQQPWGEWRPLADALPRAASLADVVADVRRALIDADQCRIVIIDDFECAAPEVQGAVLDALRRPVETACLFVLLSREPLPDAGLPTIHLSPLSPAEVEELTIELLDARPSSALVQQLVTRTQGTPLLLTHTCRWLQELAALSVRNGVADLLDPAALRVVPATLQSFMAARLELLPTSQKQLLCQLTTCGAEFDTRHLEVLYPERDVELEPLVEAGYLAPNADGGWTFSHSLIRDCAYAALPRSERRLLHRRLLRALPAQARAQRAFHAEAVWSLSSGTSYAEASLAAHDALVEVTGYARDLLPIHAAAAFAVQRRLLPCIDDYADAHPVEAAAALELLASCHHDLGRYDDAHLLAARGAQLTAGTLDGQDVHRACMLADAAALSRLGRVEAARQMLDELLLLCDTQDDRRTRGLAMIVYGDTWRRGSWQRYISQTEVGFRELQAVGDAAAAARAATSLAYVFTIAGGPRYRTWRDLTLQLDPTPRTAAWINLADALHALSTGDPETASLQVDSALAWATEANLWGLLAEALAVAADADSELARNESCLRRTAELAGLAVEHRSPRHQLMAAVGSVLPLLRTGQLDASLAALARAEEIAADLGPSEQTMVTTASAAHHLDRGRWADASSAAEAAIGSMDAVAFRLLVLQQQLLLARLQVATAPADAGWLQGLHTDCMAAGAPRLARLAQLLADQCLNRNPVGPPPTDARGFLLESAIDAEARALAQDGDETSSAPAWAAAAKVWGQLGRSIWLARAQARSGFPDEAIETLDLIGADDQARDWALGTG
ncbi:MAG TPA: adenylate/guanylate cyclase domain-containing protein [Mycobacteriales bacterium]|nr:adenylate/guanylate cyclase domain-containing protein [Mycobacteriales bacterium]